LPVGLALPAVVPFIVGKIHETLTAFGAEVSAFGQRIADVFEGPGSAGKPGWAQKNAEPAKDVSASFKEVLAAYRAGGAILPSSASSYSYLLVPGLLSDHYPGYMADNAKALRDAGLTVHVARVQTQATVEQNAKIIRDAVLEAARDGRKVVLIGHSKGGVDATAAVSLYPEIRPQVRALIAMQPAFGGSIIANDLLESTLAPLARGTVSTLFGGDENALMDVTYASRKRFLADHPYPPDVDTVALATSRFSPRSLLSPLEQYLKLRYGAASDGFLATEDQVIPGARVVRLDGVDHADGALRGLPGQADYSPGELTLALVATTLGG
jgi:pimeloyl-ACP methyl ester carboxylesterase